MTYQVVVIDTRVYIPLTYTVTAQNEKQAAQFAIEAANRDAGTPKWLSIFKAEIVEQLTEVE